MLRDRRKKRDLHALNDDGMLLCNPRDKEAAHRAEMEGIATGDPADGNIVTADWFLGGAIGYVKLQVAASQAEAALTILQNNPQLLDAGSRSETDAEDHMTCLACGERMPDDAHQCKACGWTYDSEVIDDEDD